MTLIAFIGSVFSPYYAWQRERLGNAVDPRDHCALNVALYGAQRGKWAMTERGRDQLEQSRDTLKIGPSQVRWVDGELIVDIDERTYPLPGALRGQVRLRPLITNQQALALDPAGRHRWRAIAPRAQVEVDCEQPQLRWQGTGYFDTNAGDEPLEDGFSGWHWSRAAGAEHDTTVLYDVTPRLGDPYRLALRFAGDGSLHRLPAPPPVRLPTTLWRVHRQILSERPEAAKIVDTYEDTPFYARSLAQTEIGGQALTAVHESLDLDRFASRWVKRLLPWRMPRRVRG